MCVLDELQYVGRLGIVRREKGIRLSAVVMHESVPCPGSERRARMDALADVVIRIYAPLPGPSLSYYLRRLRFAAPQWQKEIPSALQRAKARLSHARVGNVDWYWPGEENLEDTVPEVVRF